MKIISNANETIVSILKRFLKTDSCTRWNQYCVQTPVEEGMLLFNLLTRELLMLSQEEYSHYTDLSYLRDNWFLVPEDTKEKEYADLVRWVLSNRQSKTKEITGYTIFPTTDCNARCFYCFELGRSRIPMSCETAEKVARYIDNHCGGKKVRISWFGGEPLFNKAAIDTICNGLRLQQVEFISTMVSNGYLFDDETVKTAVDHWNLKRVQITLDGTEQVYNKAKAFIYREGSAYQTVLNNIVRLLDAGVFVTVRLNMDLYNADDLLDLAQELSQRLGCRKGLSVYAHHLFDTDRPMAEMHTDAEWEKRHEAMHCLEQKIAESGLASKTGISKQIKLNRCMADSGKAVTILPDGHIGLCEHFSETEFIGHIDQENFDADMVASWKETVPEIPECSECFYFLDCVMLKKCSNENVCFRQFRQEKLRKVRQNMIHEYQRWQAQVTSDEDEEITDC